jgi:hypothetical protein
MGSSGSVQQSGGLVPTFDIIEGGASRTVGNVRLDGGAESPTILHGDNDVVGVSRPMDQILESVGVLFDRSPSLVVVVRLQGDDRVFLLVHRTEKFFERYDESSPGGEAG